MNELKKHRLLFALFAGVALLDQLTKLWIEKNIPYNSFYPPYAIDVISGFLTIVHVGNTGAAWSMFSGYSHILALVGVAALCAIWVFRKHLQLDIRANQIAFGLISGGIIGNLIDRFRLGHVTDFLSFHYHDSYYFPSFNVADSGITIGVSIYAILSFLFASKEE